MSDDQRELLPTRLLRGAQGKVPEEAAIVLLTRAEVLTALYPTSIVFDLDQDLAWIDWRAATAEAGRAPADTRVVLLIAAALANRRAAAEAWSEGCPVAWGADEIATVAVRRWNSIQRRRTR